MKINFYQLLPDIYADIEIRGNRVFPCPVCGSQKQKPCAILNDGAKIYCHDPGCELSTHVYDLFGFLELTGNIDYYKQNRSRMKLATPGPHGSKTLQVVVTDKMRKCWQDTADILHEELLNSPEALDYQLSIRKHSIETLKHFKVGFISDTVKLGNLLYKKGHKLEDLMAAGLYHNRKWINIIEGCYTYPVYWRGIIKTIKSKGIDSRFIKMEFTGNDFPLMLNGDVLDKYTKLLLVEGENDLLSCYEAGYENTICLFGGPKGRQISVFNSDQYADKTYALAFDNDDSGKIHLKHALKDLKKFSIVRYSGKDPDICLKTDGRLIGI